MPSKKQAPPLDRKLVILASVQMIGAFAALLDTTIVSVALDPMARDLGASEQSIAWVSTAYLLTMALVTPLVGWAVDRFGAKTMWMSALSVFLAGSVLCGLAWSVESLVLFRVVQGLGGGLVLPLNMVILARAAGPDRFGRIMSLVGIPGQLAPILGPVAGGAVVSGSGWRWIFFLNVPLCLIALAWSARVLPRTDERTQAPLDRTGLFLLPVSLVALVYGLSRTAHSAGVTDPVTMTLLIAGAVMLVLFVLHAWRAPDPLVDLRLFSSRMFSATAMMTFLHGVAVYGPLLLLPLFFARVHGYDAGTVGWLLAPQGLGTLIGIAVAGPLADRYGPRPLVLGSTLLTLAGTLPFTQLASGPSIALLSVSLVVRGFGVGLLGVAIATAAYRDVPPERISRATSTISVLQRLGASGGTAAMTLVLAAQLDRAPGLSGPAAAGAYGNTFWWAAALTLVSLVPALLLPRVRRGGLSAAGDAAATGPDGDRTGRDSTAR